ncbi:MAG: hypothetical protein HPY57_14360 [Ignavibacteria bacterium]|nr:hypothetical protein [Ignavibacteria bacterium]
MEYLKNYSQFSQIEQIDEGLFSSTEQKGWERLDTNSLTHFIVQSWKKSYTHETNFKKIKVNLADITKEDWQRWAEICKQNNQDYKKVANAVKNDEKLNKINNYIIFRASKSAMAKSSGSHTFGGVVVVPPEKKEFDPIVAVKNAFKQIPDENTEG